jgi:hypothetical protein
VKFQSKREIFTIDVKFLGIGHRIAHRLGVTGVLNDAFSADLLPIDVVVAAFRRLM